MPDPLYTHAKLGEAVTTLATGRGRIQERLVDAVTSLVLVDAKVFEIPGIYYEAPDYWRKIWGALTAAKSPDPKRGAAATSIDQMREEEAANVAQWIVSVDAMLDSYLRDQHKH